MAPVKVLRAGDVEDLKLGDGTVRPKMEGETGPSIGAFPSLIRRDGSVPWEMRLEGAAYHMLNEVPRATLGEVLPTLTPKDRETVVEHVAAAGELVQTIQKEARRNAAFAAIQAEYAVNRFAEHHAPPLDDAVSIMLEREATAEATTDSARRRAALAREAAESTAAKDNPRDWIANEVRAHLLTLRERLRPLGLAFPREEKHTGGGLGDAVDLAAQADAALADYLENADGLLAGGEPGKPVDLGADGRTIAAKIRATIKPRQEDAHQVDTEGNEEKGRAWRLWVRFEGSPPRGPFPFLTLIARAVWRDVVRPKLEEERKRKQREQEREAKHAPGTTMEMFAELADRYRRAPDLEVTAEGFKITDADGQPVHLADLPAEVPLKLLEGAPRALATIHTYDVAVWAITQGARETWAKQGSPGRWRFEGGKHVAALIQGLESIEEPRPDARREILPKVAKAYEQAAIAMLVPFRNPRNPAEVLSLAGGRVREGRGRRPTTIELDLAGWALPGDVYDRMGGGHNARAREQRKIVPLPTGRPKLLGDPYRMTEGPAAWLFARIVGAIRLRAADVARGDGAHLPAPILATLAKEAGLNPRWIDQHLALWLSSDDAPADLEQLGRDRYHVGEAHRTARLAVDREGKKEAAGAKGKAPAGKPRKSKGK